jgi:hypothetical protein
VSTYVGAEPLVYRRGDHRVSYIRDLTRVQLNRDDSGESLGRLRRHADQVLADDRYLEYRDLSGSMARAVMPFRRHGCSINILSWPGPEGRLLT